MPRVRLPPASFSGPCVASSRRSRESGRSCASSDTFTRAARRIPERPGDAEGAASPGELLWAVRRFLEALARKRPVLLVFDDIHWAEPTPLDLIEYLAAWTAGAPGLVLCIARPELLEKRPGWERAHAIRLDPLSPDESARLVEELA